MASGLTIIVFKMRTHRNIIFDHHIRPRKKMGQCFLIDRNVIETLALLTDIHSSQVVVEIGAGTGILTELIAQKAGKVIAVELDEKLVDLLQKRLGPYANVEIYSGDILKFDFNLISKKSASKIKVMGNVPYQISSALIFKLLSDREFISTFLLMLQKEVVERIVADPGGKHYGVPSVLLQMFADVQQVMNVKPSCFYPLPKVDSAVIRGVFREKPVMELLDENFFIRLVRASFAQRRKMLINNLKHSPLLEGISESLIIEALTLAGIDGHRRAETLQKEEYAWLSNCLIKMIKE